jgi:hypothetical protein
MHTELTPRRELALLLTLAGIQFTHVVDFMIMMPLGPQLTALYQISDAQFGLLVSAYTFAAGISGLLAASFVDRFERKRLLLVLYTLFTLTTLGCAMAPTSTHTNDSPTKLLCQPAWLARNNPPGTPNTVASEKEVITKPVARPRRANGITSPITVCDMADKMPPNIPAAILASINML